MVFRDSRTYDVIRWIAQIVLPALGSLYWGLAQLWPLPYAEQVVGSIAVITTFLGALIGVSKRKYDEFQAPVDYSE